MERIETILDLIAALLQAFFFLLVDFYLPSSRKILGLFIVIVLYSIYLFGLRTYLIQRIHAKGDLDDIKAAAEFSVRYFNKEFRNDMEQIISFNGVLLAHKVSDTINSEIVQYEEYRLYHHWYHATDFIIRYFCDISNPNLIRKSVNYRYDKVYDMELKNAAAVLIHVYKVNQGFNNVIRTYHCKTLDAKLKTMIEKLQLL